MNYQYLKFSTFEEITKDILSLIVLLDNDHFPTPWSFESWEDFLKNNCFELTVMIGPEQNIVLGFALYLNTFEDSFAHLLKIVISPNERKQSLGSKLMAESINGLRKLNYKKFFLEVEESNLAALKTYQLIGFKVVHKNLNFYGASRHALIMTLDFI